MAFLSATAEIKSKLWDDEGNLEEDTLDEIVQEVGQGVAEDILKAVKKQIVDSGLTWKGDFLKDTRIEKMGDTEWWVINDTTSEDGFPYGIVLEEGFEAPPDKKIWFIGAPGLVEYLLSKGWSQGKRKGTLIDKRGVERAFMKIGSFTNVELRPFKKGFIKSQPKWFKTAGKRIVAILTV